MLIGVIAEEVLLPTSLTFSAGVAEIVVANDATITSGGVFVALVDDPASVGEDVDAYLGDIMLEAASATDTVSAGAAYTDGVDEAVTAADAPDGTLAVAMRSAMVMGVFVNAVTSRQANANGIMMNL